MTEPLPIATEPAPSTDSRTDLSAVLLHRILDAVYGGAIPEDRSGSPPEPADAEEGWQDAFERTCVSLPLRLRRVFLSPREAVAAAAMRTPLVWFGEAGEPGWFALLDRARGRALRAAGDGTEDWLRPSELAGQRGVELDEAVPFLLVEPSRPTRPAVSAAPPKNKLPPLRRLARLLQPDRADVLAVVLYAVFIGGLTLATPIAVQQLVNTVAFGGLVQPVVIVALMLFAGLAFSAILSLLQTYAAEVIQRRLFVRVAMDIADRLPRVTAAALDRKHGPELVNRIFDVFTVQKTGAYLLLDGSAVALQTIVGLIVLSFYHPLMLGFSILLVVALAILVLVLGRSTVDTAIAESNAKYAMVSWMEELADHPATFRHPGARDYAVGRADQLAAGWVGARRRHFRLVLRQIGGAVGIQVFAGSALLALGGALVVGGQLTLGQLVAAELIITAIVAGVARLGKQLESYYDLLAAVDKLGVLLDLPLERTDGNPVELPDGPASIEVRDLSFGYSGRPFIRNFDLDVRAGERLLLTGPAGSGKSTLLDLLRGLHDPSSGYIALDGVDLREFYLEDIRSQVVCLSEPEIFSGTVLDHLRSLDPHVAVTEASAALAQIGVLDSIRALPDGLNTRLSTDGSPLSDSQIAAIALAATIVARPRVLLLDEEALTRLEPTQREIALDAMFAADAPWTVVAVSELRDVRSRCTRVVDIHAGSDSEAPNGDAS